MKKQDIIFGITKVILDFLIVIASFFIARKLRLISDFIPGLNLQIQTIDTYNLFIYSIIGAFVLIFLFSIHGLYKIKIINSKIKEFFNIIVYGFYSFVFFSFLVYLGIGFLFDIEIPRLIAGFAFLISIFLIILERILLNNLYYFLMNKKIISKNDIILITNNDKKEIKHIIDDINKAKIYNLTIPEENFDNLCDLIKERKIDEILYINSNFSKKQKFDFWELTRIFGIRYRYLTNGFDITKTNTELTLINEIPVLEIKSTSLQGWNTILKRIFDILFSIIGIIIFSPLLLVIYVLIKIENLKAPAIFKNKRIGKNFIEFNLYKYRYLKWDFCIKDSYNVSEENKKKALEYEQKLIEKYSKRKGPLYKIKNDPRKTKIGSFIEKYSIDELPQLFNVLIGNMSLVGPRPHQPREVKKYLIQHKRLLTIKPGITGMAQVNGRDNNTFDDEAKLDTFYIENWSLLLDLKIILKTFSEVFKR